MPRSPRATRKRGQGKVKTGSRRSLSADNDLPSASPHTDSMAPTASASTEAVNMNKIEDYLKSNSFIEKIVSSLADRVRDGVVLVLQQSLGQAQEMIKELSDKVASLENKLQCAERQDNSKRDELEQYIRRNNLRFFGIPEQDGENTDNIILKVCKKKLGVDLSLDRLERSHRVGKSRTPGEDGKSRPRPIIVKFASYRDRREVFTKKKTLKGTSLTIREDSTANRAAVLRKVIDLYGPKKAWTSDGRIIYEDKDGRTHVATSLADLE